MIDVAIEILVRFHGLKPDKANTIHVIPDVPEVRSGIRNLDGWMLLDSGFCAHARAAPE